jgi:hypothetical protein
MNKGIVLLAAGGTGGHVFPAEALAYELKARGYQVHLVTDSRAERYAGKFPADESDCGGTFTVEAVDRSSRGTPPHHETKAGGRGWLWWLPHRSATARIYRPWRSIDAA